MKYTDDTPSPLPVHITHFARETDGGRGGGDEGKDLETWTCIMTVSLKLCTVVSRLCSHLPFSSAGAFLFYSFLG